ncbi:hypothetical protein [Parapedobacter sp. DT-150]|uniref:hypothetical protein n=1 Tax=Parapedobacter sp. DT-150 TaxID=3396162 RepID=UPI003F1DC8A7
MKINTGIKIISIYLLLSALICVFYLILVVIKMELNSTGAWLSVIVPGLIIAVTILNAINVLASKKRGSLIKGSTINGAVLALQILTLAMDGFYYRYTQGNKFFVFVNYEHLTKNVRWGSYFEPMVLDFNLKFDPSENTLVGINLLALVLATVSFWMAHVLKKRIDTPK